MGFYDIKTHELFPLYFHLGMDQYLLIPFLGDEHPFTSYFDVNYRGTRF